MILSTDQLKRTIELHSPVTKIISLVPSQTELLCTLGLTETISGITRFCVHPSHLLKEKTVIGGTKNLNIEKIKSLNPDLIIANKEENEQEQILQLAQEYPVWVSDVNNLNDALEMILEIGRITGRENTAREINKKIQNKFDILENQNRLSKGKKAAYVIWRNPYLSAGSKTFIHDMLTKSGFINVFEEGERYPEFIPEQLKAADPDFILLASEPYPFSQKHINEFKNICPKARIMLVDGEMFSWYGSHLLSAADYFHSLVKEIDSAS